MLIVGKRRREDYKEGQLQEIRCRSSIHDKSNLKLKTKSKQNCENSEKRERRAL
jgi:hypothetical protein